MKSLDIASWTAPASPSRNPFASCEVCCTCRGVLKNDDTSSGAPEHPPGRRQRKRATEKANPGDRSSFTTVLIVVRIVSKRVAAVRYGVS